MLHSGLVTYCVNRLVVTNFFFIVNKNMTNLSRGLGGMDAPVCLITFNAEFKPYVLFLTF